MNLQSKKTELITLAITAIVLSRIMFYFFHDPEGPNLLVVGVAAAIVYALSFAVYNLSNTKKLLNAIFIQFIIIISAYFLLK
ncbi:MAG: hypothetical protein V4486_03815 [Patescibacteria group bacterium]